MKKSYLSANSLIAIGSLLVFTGVSCDLSKLTISTGSKSGDSGVYKSESRGENWQHMVFVERAKKKVNTIGSVNVANFVMDPKDSRIIYLITKESGVWKTMDGAGAWKQVFPGGGIADLAIDARDTNNLYVASGNRISRSDDAGKSWRQIYLESRPSVGINALVVDRGDSQHVFAGTSAGDVLETRDEGETWTVVHRFDSTSVVLLRQLITRVLFAVTPGQGVWRSRDLGKSWTAAAEKLKDKPGAYDIRNQYLDPATVNGLYLTTNYGIFRTTNAGDTWEEVTLIARPGNVDIQSFAVNPMNSREIYYAVPGGFHRSFDLGKTWTTLPLPVGHLPTALVVDWYDPGILYLGVTKVKK